MKSPCADIWAPAALSYFTASTSGVLSVLSTVGNFLIILAVVKDPHKKLRTPFMYFLVNLAFSDLVVGGITLPTSVITHTMEAHGTKKKVHVRIIQVSYFMSSTASMLSLATLCIDRYLAIKHPMSYRRKIKLPICIGISLLIWVISIALPFLFFVVGYMNYLMIFAHTAVGVTLIIIAFTYRNIYKIIQDQAMKMKEYKATPKQGLTVEHEVEEKATSLERNVTRVFLLILCYVIVCYVPAIICIYILRFCPNCNCNFRHVLRDFQFLFIVSNSCINPFLCSIRLRPFRNALADILRLKRLRSQSESGEGGSRNKTGSTLEGNSTPTTQVRMLIVDQDA